MSAAVECEEIAGAFSGLPACQDVDGGVEYVTQCLYPSFDPVRTFIMRSGSGFVVHDCAGAARSAWTPNSDARTVERALNEHALAYRLTVRDSALTAEVPSLEWLPSAVMAVANASAAVARAVVPSGQLIPSFEATLRDVIYTLLQEMVAEASLANGYDLRGRSGKKHHFDFAVRQKASLTLIDAVSPHHVSIASRYVAFSDTRDVSDEIRGRFIVHDRPLEQDDVALLSQFADVVPIASLRPGLQKYLS